MDRRTKILAGILGGFVALGFVARVIWPAWIAPILSIDDRIVERQARLDKLQADQDDVDRAKKEYRVLVGRVGSFDSGQAQTAILDRVGSLIDKNKLQNVNVTPARPKLDNKTGIVRMVVTVKGVATLEHTVSFLRDLAELPQIVRIGNSAITPSSRKRRSREKQKMTLRIPIEVLVIPQQKVVRNIDLASLDHPTSKTRHAERNYSEIWDLKPFSEYIPPPLLRAVAGRAIRDRPSRKKVKTDGSATGGEGPYTCWWEPTDHLGDPNVCDTSIDISEEFEQVFTLHVRDEAGNTASAQKSVSIKIPPAPQAPEIAKIEPKRPSAPVVKRWRDGEHMQLRMALLATSKTGDTGEMAVFNKRAKRMTYYALGDDFDGGKLVYVHPTGAVARRSDAYYIYPIGLFATEDVAVAEADEVFSLDYPRLVQMADWMTRRDAAASKAEAEAKAAKGAVSRKTSKPAPSKGAVKSKRPSLGGAKAKPAVGGAKKKPVGRRIGKKPGGGRKPAKEYPPLPADELERIEKEYAAKQKAKLSGGLSKSKKAKKAKGATKKPG